MKNNIRRLIFPLLIFGISCLQAQDTLVRAPGRWEFLAEPYLMFPNMKGQITVRNLPEAEIDANESRILGNLEFGAMIYVEANNGRWAITSDFIYMKLAQSLQSGSVVSGGKVNMEELAWELAGLRRIGRWLELGAGGRLMSLTSSLAVQTIVGGSQKASISRTWFDPIIVARSKGTVHEKWLWLIRADLGGFGLGSDFTWQAQAYGGYRFSRLFQATLGYRYIGINYDKGSGQERFLYDVDTFGWVVRLGFNF